MPRQSLHQITAVAHFMPTVARTENRCAVRPKNISHSRKQSLNQYHKNIDSLFLNIARNQYSVVLMKQLTNIDTQFINSHGSIQDLEFYGEAVNSECDRWLLRAPKITLFYKVAKCFRGKLKPLRMKLPSLLPPPPPPSPADRTLIALLYSLSTKIRRYTRVVHTREYSPSQKYGNHSKNFCTKMARFY